ncbi:hypothetical protein IW152_002150 [Coemansia sp. BCRC 34962]|nr:hypothetical protein IW152_002150 [Coemansia sp. BCRC 34962]
MYGSSTGAEDHQASGLKTCLTLYNNSYRGSKLTRILQLLLDGNSKNLITKMKHERLVGTTSTLCSQKGSGDRERFMVQNLRVEYGPGYAKRLEGMLRDMDVSSDLEGKFTNLQQAQETSAIDFHATILTQAFWPTYEPLPLVIPRDVELAQEQFVQFYNEKHNGRKLFWQPNLGTCLLKVVFDEGIKELLLTIMQGTVLLLFSEQDVLSYKQIQENTGLEGVELIRTLQSLACGKLCILTKEPRRQEVAATDVFTFNVAFKSSHARIKIGQILLKEVEKESKEVEEHIQFDRMYQVDAAIVRILKARKQADHPTLMSELPGQLKFNSTATEVKEHIETLIERDYLKRDDTDPSIYHYLVKLGSRPCALKLLNASLF